jgi:hypothetical protein
VKIPTLPGLARYFERTSISRTTCRKALFNAAHQDRFAAEFRFDSRDFAVALSVRSLPGRLSKIPMLKKWRYLNFYNGGDG